MTHLWDGLCTAYRVLGFGSITKGDNVFRDPAIARIIEPTSKVDAGRVLDEGGVEAASYATVKRRLPVYARPGWRGIALNGIVAGGSVFCGWRRGFDGDQFV